MYSIMSCSGWGSEGTALLGACAMSWLSFVVIVFLAMILKRQCDDGILAGTGYNLAGALGGGIGVGLIITTFFGSALWSMMLGIAGVIIGGFLFGMFFGNEGEYD